MHFVHHVAGLLFVYSQTILLFSQPEQRLQKVKKTRKRKNTSNVVKRCKKQLEQKQRNPPFASFACSCWDSTVKVSWEQKGKSTEGLFYEAQVCFGTPGSELEDEESALGMGRMGEVLDVFWELPTKLKHHMLKSNMLNTCWKRWCDLIHDIESFCLSLVSEIWNVRMSLVQVVFVLLLSTSAECHSHPFCSLYFPCSCFCPLLILRSLCV